MLLSLPYTRSAAATRKGTDHDANEDSFNILDANASLVRMQKRGVIYAVADGVSSAARGSWAARTACERLERFFYDHAPPKLDELRRIVGEVDGELARFPGAAACTLSTLWLYDGQAYLLHIGNSEILRLRDGVVSRISRNPGRSSRRQLRAFLGMGRVADVLQVEQLPLEEGDVFLLFTDGVREAFSVEGLLDAWRMVHGDPLQFVEAVLDEVERKSVTDDATLIAAQVLAMETPEASLGVGARPTV